MKIIDTKTEECLLDDVENGECFMFNNHIYLKLDGSNGYTNVYDLIDNTLQYISLVDHMLMMQD